MTWARLDDSFHSHPKAWQAGLDGCGLFARCLSYAADHLTDGFVPEDWVRAQVAGKRGVLTRVLDAGLMEKVKGGYRIHDFLDYNPSRAKVEEQRESVAEARRKAGKRGAEKRWANSRRDGKRDSKAMANPEASCQDVVSLAAWQNDAPEP